MFFVFFFFIFTFFSSIFPVDSFADSDVFFGTSLGVVASGTPSYSAGCDSPLNCLNDDVDSTSIAWGEGYITHRFGNIETSDIPDTAVIDKVVFNSRMRGNSATYTFLAVYNAEDYYNSSSFANLETFYTDEFIEYELNPHTSSNWTISDMRNFNNYAFGVNVSDESLRSTKYYIEVFWHIPELTPTPTPVEEFDYVLDDVLQYSFFSVALLLFGIGSFVGYNFWSR